MVTKKLTYRTLDRWINSDREIGRGERGDTIGVIKGFSFVPGDDKGESIADHVLWSKSGLTGIRPVRLHQRWS